MITHSLNALCLGDVVQAIETRVRQAGDMPYVTVDQQLEYLSQMTQTPLGRFLLTNQGGLNGYWTDHLVHFPDSGEEGSFIERAPLALATQERYRIFKRVMSEAITEGMRVASVPCGLMRDLMTLDLPPGVQLVGFDYDEESLRLAKGRAEEYDLSNQVVLHQLDAWELAASSEFGLLTSNGLNCYEPDEERLCSLYGKFFDALTPGGLLVTSFMTPPHVWDMSQVDQEAMLRQKVVFVDMLPARWQSHWTHDQVRKQLEGIGFTQIEFIDDRAKMFPTVKAYKPTV